jgi:hypothetical protein
VIAEITSEATLTTWASTLPNVTRLAPDRSVPSIDTSVPPLSDPTDG